MPTHGACRSKMRFLNTAQWNDFANVVEFGTTIKARNQAREYGDENPKLTFTVIGDKVKGKPVLSCEATAESKCGRYTIHIEPELSQMRRLILKTAISL